MLTFILDSIEFVQFNKFSSLVILANNLMMNRLISEIALTVQETIRALSTSSIKVSLGNIFGSQLLAQYGPNIDINVTPIGRVNVDFFTEFEQSGINQARHKIYLVVKAEVKTIVPFSSSTMMVELTIPIAETIIVGKVPPNYINVPEDEFMNVVPNGGENLKYASLSNITKTFSILGSLI
ncbi:sporulation protein YunB [Sporosalibacterium faouarense]|uniref:sporulation protein YunB n=1 Tax=Sporosalibacterium faouarense TaxID=516123 RepID=UPI00192B8132